MRRLSTGLLSLTTACALSLAVLPAAQAADDSSKTASSQVTTTKDQASSTFDMAGSSYVKWLDESIKLDNASPSTRNFVMVLVDFLLVTAGVLVVGPIVSFLAKLAR